MPTPPTTGNTSGRPGVYLEGLTDFRKVLRNIDKNLALSVTRSLREIGRRVQTAARSHAQEFAQTGDLARSLRYSVTQRQASVYSNSEYAAVHQWGGSVRPRGVRIDIPARMYLTEGIRDEQASIRAQLEDVLDRVANDWAS